MSQFINTHFFSRGKMFSAAITFFLLLTVQKIWSSELQIYSLPDFFPQNNDFRVRVRSAGKSWVEVPVAMVHVVKLVSFRQVRQNSSMCYFDFSGEVEVEITYNNGVIEQSRIRPLSAGVQADVCRNIIRFKLNKPVNISVEVNGDIHQNLHVFSNPIEDKLPFENDHDMIYLGPGLHEIDTLYMKSNQSLYIAGGAVLKGKIVCDKVENVRIFGRGIVYQGHRGVEITHSKNITIEDLIFVNPVHYTIYGGASNGITIKNIRSFSARGWGDGIDLMSCSDVLVDGVFMRNSDDCIAIYCHRWDYYGDARNITVQNSILWADIAHPINFGTHGNPDPAHAEMIENVVFRNIDILNHNEPQIDYQGCIAINVSEQILARNLLFEDIRIDEIQQGQLINIRVTFNKKYAKAPGRGVENVVFRNISYNGKLPSTSIISGYNEERMVRNIVFENLQINGVLIYDEMHGKPGFYKTSDVAGFYIGEHVEGVQFLKNKD